jgi:CRP-like cAMP-binding protein
MTGMYTKDDYIGIHSLLSNEPFSDTATAIEETALCLIPKEQLDELLNQHPDLAREFIKLLSNDIREKEEQLAQLAYNSVHKRMADIIVRLSKRQSGSDDNIKISREDLAAMAGMATETVSRTLSDFKDEGLIEKKGSTIIILNLVRLAKMKN